jgi:hypothetical protein
MGYGLSMAYGTVADGLISKATTQLVEEVTLIR